MWGAIFLYASEGFLLTWFVPPKLFDVVGGVDLSSNLVKTPLIRYPDFGVFSVSDFVGAGADTGADTTGEDTGLLSRGAPFEWLALTSAIRGFSSS